MISLDQLRKAARVRGTSQDSYLKGLELAAVDYLEARSGRYYGQPVTGFVEYIIGHGDRELVLEELPNDTNPVTVVEHQTPGDSGTTIVASDDDGFLVRERTLVRKGGAVWLPGCEYETTYDRGYESGKEPARARDFVTKLVTYWFERRTPVPKVGETHTFDVPHHLQAMLKTLDRLQI